MMHRHVLIAVSGLALATALIAQTTSQSNSNSRSGSGQASGWSSSSSSASGSKSASSRAGGSHSGFGSASGSAFGAKPTHAILYKFSARVDSDATRQRFMNAHLKYLGEQGKNVIFYGPWRDLPGSMAVVVARTDEQAAGIAQNDPAVKGGGLEYEVRAWTAMVPTAERAR